MDKTNGIESFDLVVVGAGFYGIVMAKTYLEANPHKKLLLLDSSMSVGGVWSKERLYKDLHTNNRVGTFEFSDLSLNIQKYELEGKINIPGPILHQYLTDYAKNFGVFERVRFRAVVRSARLMVDGSWVLIYSKDSVERQLLTQKLVVATGSTSQPHVPSVPGIEKFAGPKLHSQELSFREDDLASAKSTVVYGGSKSAADAVYVAAKEGRHVDWVIRESGRGPYWLSHLKCTPLKLWFEDLSTTRFLTWFYPTVESDGYTIPRWFLERTWLGRKLVTSYLNIVDQDVLNLGRFNEHSETKKLIPWASMFWYGSGVGTFNYPTDFFELIRNGTVKVHIADVTDASSDIVHLSDGTSLQTDIFVYATGYKLVPGLKFHPEGLEQKVGPVYHSPTDPKIQKIDQEIKTRFPILANQPPTGPSVKFDRPSWTLFRSIVPPSMIESRNLTFCGMNSNVSGTICAQAQALWITAFLDNKLEVPPGVASGGVEKIEQEALLHSRFWRWRAPFGQGQQMPERIFECVPYVDTLLRDLGLETRRKGGWREIFTPYGVKDYAGLVGEWLNKRKKTN